MATHKSAIKEHRQSLGRRMRNRTHRSKLRGVVKTFRSAIDAGDAQLAGQLLPGTLSLLDRTAKLGAMHRTAASRAKSRLSKALNRLGS